MIFIVGSSRSGTTMMGRILGNHKKIFTFHETHFFEQIWSVSDEQEYLTADHAAQLAAKLLSIQRDGYFTRGNYQKYLSEGREIISRSGNGRSLSSANIYRNVLVYESARMGKVVPCEKTPRNVFYLSEILRLYPEARVIQMVRDPRDVLFSQKNKWRRRLLGASNIPVKEAFRSWMNYHPMTMSQLWVASVRAGDQYCPDMRICPVKYEDLLNDPEGVIQKVCLFLGVEYSKALLHIPKIGSSHTQDRPEIMGIDTQWGGRWRSGGLNGTEIFISQRMTQEIAAVYGYTPTAAYPNPFRFVYYLCTWPIKMGLAFVLNIRRMRNIKDAMRRRIFS